jgi:flagellar brake protein
LQPGTRIGELRLELDSDTQFSAAVTLQHVSSFGGGSGAKAGEGGARLGCEWQNLGGSAERVLQRWIDEAQKRRRLLTLG